MIKYNKVRTLTLRECIAGINRGELGIFNFAYICINTSLISYQAHLDCLKRDYLARVYAEAALRLKQIHGIKEPRFHDKRRTQRKGWKNDRW